MGILNVYILICEKLSIIWSGGCFTQLIVKVV